MRATADWHTLSRPAAHVRLQSTLAGLTEAEALRRLAQYGPNELQRREERAFWRILWRQFTSILVVVLLVAGFASAALGDFHDAFAIGAILLLNAAFGFFQEYRAERAIAVLKSLAVPATRVRREGEVREISTTQLVPGDIVLLEAGNLVPADCRLLESAALRVDESALTGESVPVEKDVEAVLTAQAALADRVNMLYRGTTVTYGRCVAVVTGTGMATELGRIASLLQTTEAEPTPLQRRLEQVGARLAALALVLVGVIFLLGLLRGEPLRLLFLTAVSLGVAAVPEGLPAVVTIALALGSQRMLRRKALVRRLSAVETLGSTTVICSDKTGTLTQNSMVMVTAALADRRYAVAPGSAAVNEPPLLLLLAAGALCNDATPRKEEGEEHSCRALGDPTEVALLVAACESGIRKAELDAALPRVGELPFDSQRKLMTTVHRLANDGLPLFLGAIHEASGNFEYLAVTKGAFDNLLRISSSVWIGDRAYPLTTERRDRLIAEHDRMAGEGMRVLALAMRVLPTLDTESGLERDAIFLGLVGLMDPLRPEVSEAVQVCRNAGIRPVMITGDHPLTAKYIAAQLGIPTERIVTGHDLSALPREEWPQTASEVSVYARVAPEHKLQIIEMLQRQQHVVAMTGDGVNDAPALKRANIGVAMGLVGTDVARESADLVLQDDNFATIVAAVEEGRVIYDNLRKVIRFLLTANLGEIWVMLLGPLLGMPLPLLPLQILWMNLVTDGLPALALGVEPPESDVMRRPPHPPGESIFARGMGRSIVWIGMVLGLVALGAGFVLWRVGQPQWQTVVFTILTLSQLWFALALRSERRTLTAAESPGNRPLFGAVVGMAVLHCVVIYTPLGQSLLGTHRLGLFDFALCLALSTIVYWVVKLEKLMKRHRGSE